MRSSCFSYSVLTLGCLVALTGCGGSDGGTGTTPTTNVTIAIPKTVLDYAEESKQASPISSSTINTAKSTALVEALTSVTPAKAKNSSSDTDNKSSDSEKDDSTSADSSNSDSTTTNPKTARVVDITKTGGFFEALQDGKTDFKGIRKASGKITTEQPFGDRKEYHGIHIKINNAEHTVSSKPTERQKEGLLYGSLNGPAYTDKLIAAGFIQAAYDGVAYRDLTEVQRDEILSKLDLVEVGKKFNELGYFNGLGFFNGVVLDDITVYPLLPEIGSIAQEYPNYKNVYDKNDPAQDPRNDPQHPASVAGIGIRKFQLSDFAAGFEALDKDNIGWVGSFFGKVKKAKDSDTQQSGDYTANTFGELRYGVFTDKNNITHMFIQGTGTPSTAFGKATNDTDYAEYTYRGNAIIGKDGKYEPLEKSVEATLTPARDNLNVRIKVDDTTTLRFNNNIIYATGSNRDNVTNGVAFSSKDGQDVKAEGGFFSSGSLAGAFEVVKEGKYKGYNGVFAADRSLATKNKDGSEAEGNYPEIK